MTMHVFDIRQSITAALEAIPTPEKKTTEGLSEPMDWEWTPKPLPVPNLADELENKIKKGKLKANPAEDLGNAADRRKRTRRGGTVPPPTSQGSLGSSQNTGRKRHTTLTSKKGSGSGAPPKKPRQPEIGGNSGTAPMTRTVIQATTLGNYQRRKLPVKIYCISM